MKSKYLLVSLEACWADEFDINALWVTTQETYDTFLKSIDKVKFNNQEIYFGTNEAVEFSSKEDFLSSIAVTEISESFYNEFYSIFMGYTYGMIDISSLPERLEEYDEEEFEGDVEYFNMDDDGEGEEF